METLRAVLRPASGSSLERFSRGLLPLQPATHRHPQTCLPPHEPAGCTVWTPAAHPSRGREDLRPCPPAPHPGAEAALTKMQEVGAAGWRRSAVGGGERRGLGGRGV